MAAYLKLYVDWFNLKLVLNSKSTTQFTLPSFHYGDVIPFQITILEPDTINGIAAYTLPDISNMGLKLIVSSAVKSGGTSLVTQFTWNKNTAVRYFYADVAFNTSALTTWLGSDASKTGYFELQFTEGSATRTIYKSAVTITVPILTPATLVVPAGETPLSMETAKAMFAQKLMPAGETLTFTSADGNSQRILGVNDDKTAADNVI